MRLPKLVRWGVKSAVGLAANLLLLTVWVDGVGIPPWLAVGINWVLISMVGYVVTDRWVFATSPSPSGLVDNAKRYLGMQSVMTGGKAVNYAIYLGLMSVGLDYRLAWTAGAVVVFFSTFAGNRWLWTRISQSH